LSAFSKATFWGGGGAKLDPGHVHPLLLSLCRNAVGSAARARGDLESALAIHLANLESSDGVPFVSVSDVCADLALLGRWTESAEYARGVATTPLRCPPTVAATGCGWKLKPCRALATPTSPRKP
jgi:hypothetical protein